MEGVANIKIRTSGPVAEVYIDGKKVPRVQAFKVEMNAILLRIHEAVLMVLAFNGLYH